jgi:transcriptional regulator with XRE-family HTH domain
MAGRGEFGPTGFGGRLRAAREGKNWTQQQLAEAASTHVNTIARLERGEQEPAWPLVLKLAAALGVDCTAFAGDVVGKPEPDVKPAKGKPKK